MRDATILARPAGMREHSEARQGGRARLLRRVVLFQVKLFADGIRDVVMSPLSLVAGVLGLFASRNPEGDFERLMLFGRQTDRWINLFDIYGTEEARQQPTLDKVAEDIEAAIRRDYANGWMSARSAQTILALARQLRARRGRPCP